jgi:hypothetical protein
MITIRKVTSNVQSAPVSLQTCIDTPNCVLDDRVLYNTVHIPNVFCDGHLQLINCVGIVIVSCTGTYYRSVYWRISYFSQACYTLLPSL